MIGAGAYFTADMANLALGSYLAQSFDKPTQPAPPPSNRSTQSGAVRPPDYQNILKRNIFNSNPKPQSLSSPGLSNSQTTAPVPVALSPLNLTLVGTVIPKHGVPYAVFSAMNQQEQTIYRQGDLVTENAKLVEIERHQAVIQRGAQREVIELAVKPQTSQGRVKPVARRVEPAAPQPSVGDTIRQVSENQWLLDRREIDSAMTNLPQLLTKARIIPNFKDGKPDGFRIFAIAKDSLYSKIGLNNGDILNRINGIDVKDPQNFMKVLEQLKDENSIHIDLVRNNQKQTFDYEIR